MVLVRVREDDPTNVREFDTVCGEPISECLRRFVSFWPDVDQRQGVLADQINIDGNDIERRRDRERDELLLLVL